MLAQLHRQGYLRELRGTAQILRNGASTIDLERQQKQSAGAIRQGIAFREATRFSATFTLDGVLEIQDASTVSELAGDLTGVRVRSHQSYWTSSSRSSRTSDPSRGGPSVQNLVFDVLDTIDGYRGEIDVHGVDNVCPDVFVLFLEVLHQIV